MKSCLTWLRRNSGRSLWVYVLCLLLGTASQVLLLVQPRFGGELIAKVQNGDPIAGVVAVLVAIMLVNAVITMLQQALLGKKIEDSARDKRESLLVQFFDTTVLELESRAFGWYSQRLTSDVDLTKTMAAQGMEVFQAILVLMGSMLALLYIEPVTFLVGAFFGILSMVFVAIASRPLVGLRKEIQDAHTSITNSIQECIRAGRILRAFNAWGISRSKMYDEAEVVHTAGVRLALMSCCLFPISSVLMQLANIGTILFGSYRVASGVMGFSELVMFLMYFSSFSSSVTRLTASISKIRNAEAGKERICEFESIGGNRKTAKTSGSGGLGVRACPAEIVFDDVDYGYHDGDLSLKGVSLTVPSGKKTAIVGASGGGKTTCLGLLEKFYQPSSGEIRIDGIPLCDIDTSRLRDSIGYIDQDATILNGTVRSNLCMGVEGFSDSDLEHAVRMVGLELPGQFLDYATGENGSALSGGQRQRLALARCLLRNPSILIMDEPTSALDGISESEINRLLDIAFPSATVVYTAHRLSLILSSDWIVVLRGGEVIAQGTHERLLEECPYYRKLISSQSL